MLAGVLLLVDHDLSMAHYSCEDLQRRDLTFFAVAAEIIDVGGGLIVEVVVVSDLFGLTCEKHC